MKLEKWARIREKGKQRFVSSLRRFRLGSLYRFIMVITYGVY